MHDVFRQIVGGRPGVEKPVALVEPARRLVVGLHRKHKPVPRVVDLRPLEHPANGLIPDALSPDVRVHPQGDELDRAVATRCCRAHHAHRPPGDSEDEVQRHMVKPVAPPLLVIPRPAPLDQGCPERRWCFGKRGPPDGAPELPVPGTDPQDIDHSLRMPKRRGRRKPRRATDPRPIRLPAVSIVSEDAVMGYSNTFIAVADDCPARTGRVPPARASGPTVAWVQYTMLALAPGRWTQEDVLWASSAQVRGGELDEAARDRARAEYFSIPRACLRASPLPKAFGWGLHYDSAGGITLHAVDSPEYARLSVDPSLQQLRAMRSSRR